MAALAGKAAWDAWVDQARNADILQTAQRYGARVKKTSTTEWSGPCPSCRGTDRFSVNVKKRVFNCRGCGGSGDVIAFVGMMTGGAFVDCCEAINGTPRPDRSRDETMEQRQARMSLYAARTAQIEQREAEERAAEAARAKHDEEVITKVIDRSVALAGTFGEAYLRGRGLTPHKRLIGDIRFVPDLDYWGAKDNGTRSIIHLATLPAIIAIIRDFAGIGIGISQTYLDPKEPRKWRPEGSPTNSPKKIRGEKKGGMIFLGFQGETIAMSEGWENALAFHQSGYCPPDTTLAAAVDLGNLAGGATGSWPHPVLKDADGKPVRIKNGIPDMAHPGVILQDGVKRIILVADRNSESYATAAQLRTAGKRFVAKGIDVAIAWPDAGKDWNDMVIAQMGEEHGRAASA